MTASPTLVSVIIPVYNGASFLAEAIESVIDQTYSPFELLVVDDGSTDASADIARSYEPVRYLHQANRGQGAALNHGLDLASGDFIAFLDADDLWLPGKLQAHIDFHRMHPQLDLTYSCVQVFLHSGTSRPAWLPSSMLAMPKPAAMPSSIVVQRRTFTTLGSFNPDNRSASDFEWFLRAWRAGVRKALIDTPLVRKRIHPGNASAQAAVRADMRAQFFRYARDAFQNRRDARVT